MMHTNQLPATHDIVCFSNLRWDQEPSRTHQLLSRFVKQRRVFYIEKPKCDSERAPRTESKTCPRTGIHIVSPCVPRGWPVNDTLRIAFAAEQIHRPIVWLWSQEALESVPASISPAAVVYDCISPTSDDSRLLRMADLVFAAGPSLYQAKRHLHPKVYSVPNGVDVRHFGAARGPREEEPADQKDLPRPRLGCVCSENFGLDRELLRAIAERRPEWQFIVLADRGGVDLPNIHWLGAKHYDELPRYLSGWDLAMMPLTLDSGPDQAGNYLAAGLPVVSSPLPDIVQSFGNLGLIRIASGPDEFVGEAEHAMLFGMSLKWRERADAFLQSMSWDQSWGVMNEIIEQQLTGAGTYPVLPEHPMSQTRSTVR